MKKFTLTVSEPCHENWSAMTPEDKGRYCASCRKTVVDFTNMSDRQIADYFKQASGSLCGRFYNDQLNREITAPKKSVPVLKYLFTVPWPAVVLLLKSCGQREKTLGQIAAQQIRIQEATMGVVLPKITPVADNRFTAKVLVQEAKTLMGDTIIRPVAEAGCTETVTMNEVANSTVPQTDSASIYKEPIACHSASAADDSSMAMTVGMVAVVRKSYRSAPAPESNNKNSDAATVTNKLSIYPNPVQAGQTLVVRSERPIQGGYRIFHLSGQELASGRLLIREKQTFSIPVQAWPAGTYVLQVIDETTKASASQTFIVLQ